MVSPIPDWLRALPVDKRVRCYVRDFGTAIYFPDLDEEMGVNEVFGVPEDVLYELAGFRKGPRPTPGTRPSPRRAKRRPTRSR